MVPISYLFEEYMLLFDEPEKAVHSEAKATNINIDHLKNIIDEAPKDMESEPQVEKQTPSVPIESSESTASTDPPKESFNSRGRVCLHQNQPN